jgi:tetratricopeptide (TPR) repeat protein
VLRYFLASIYVDEGRFNDAEPILKDVIAAIGTHGGDDVGLVSPLSTLGNMYVRQGRYGEAEPLLKRALAINQNRFPGRPETAETLNTLASFYGKTGHLDLAEPLFEQAITILQASGPALRDELAVALGNQGVVEQTLGNYPKALTRFHDAYMANLQIHGPDHPFTIVAMSNAGVLYGLMGEYDQAGPLLQRSLDSTDRLYGDDALQTAHARTALGWVDLEQGNARVALELLRPAVRTYLRIRRVESRSATALAGGVEGGEVGRAILGFLKAARAVSDADPSAAPELLNEAFRAVQEAHTGKAAEALALTTARFAAGADPLAALIRQEQDFADRWRSLNSDLTGAYALPAAQRNPPAEDNAQKTLAGLERQILQTDQQIATRFPTYATLAHPDAIDLASAQRLLRADEALVTIAAFGGANGEGGYIFVVTQKEARWRALDVGLTDLTKQVFTLLCGLDSDLWVDDGSKRCAELTHLDQPADRLPFDASAAYALYTTLFGDLAPMLAGKTLLVVAPDPLASLPLQVLVTDPPANALPATDAEFRAIVWLGRSNPIAVLPSVAGLAGLRVAGTIASAPEPFIGFGDPTLTGSRRCPKYDDVSDACPSEGTRAPATTIASLLRGGSPGAIESLFRGGGIDVDAVRALCPLPETATELHCVAESLEAGDAAIRTGGAATLTALRKEPLDRYRVIEFATHGLVAGELKTDSGALTEPVLVLTPDDSAHDDGLLRASEIATLKLNADWVVLSACNTAAGDSLGGEAMSGLASAFIYAGARALLVSHWPVGSDATVRLTSRTFAEIAKDPAVSRAEALRRSMTALIDDGGDGDAMPSTWAPFSLVGDDGGLTIGG